MDHSVNERGIYSSDSPALLPERIVRVVQIATKDLIQEYDLKAVLDKSDLLSKKSLEKVKSDPLIQMLGVDVLSTSIHAISPTPAMARALEAAARESLQRSSDEAMSARRNAVVEQERQIKENELKTEIAVEQKRRQIREAKMEADISIEKQRETLISQKIENDKKEADSRAYNLEVTLKPLRDMDWKILMAAQAENSDPKMMIALAFREMAENASKIGELNISPDLLNSLLKTEAHPGNN